MEAHFAGTTRSFLVHRRVFVQLFGASDNPCMAWPKVLLGSAIQPTGNDTAVGQRGRRVLLRRPQRPASDRIGSTPRTPGAFSNTSRLSLTANPCTACSLARSLRDYYNAQLSTPDEVKEPPKIPIRFARQPREILRVRVHEIVRNADVFQPAAGEFS